MNWSGITLVLCINLQLLIIAKSGPGILEFKQTFPTATAENEKEIKLICQVTGPKAAQYWWLKDGKNIDTTKKRFRYKHLRYLKIKNVRKSDAGNYTCMASKNNFTIKHTMHLYVSERLISYPIVEQINNVTAYVGDNVTVTCKAYSDAIPHFQWLIYSAENKNTTVLRPKLKEYDYLIPSGKDKLYGVKLFLPNVSFEDQKEYTCLAGNYIGYSHKAFFLHVLPRIHSSEKSLKFRKTFGNTSAAENAKEIKLICRVSGPKETRYWWLKDGKKIHTVRKKFRYKHFRYLKIRNVRRSDAGNYTCMASKNNFTIKHTMHLYVSDPRPTEFPMDVFITSPVIKKIDNVTVYKDDNVTVSCQAYSYVLPEFAWLVYDKVNENMTKLKPRLKEHEYLIPTSSDRRLHGFKLFLPKVSFEDQREYTCFASNQFGYDYTSFFLHILRRRLVQSIQSTVPPVYNNSQSTVLPVYNDNNDSDRKIIIIVPIVAFCVLLLVVSLMWLFSVHRKRHQDDASLRHSVHDVGNGDVSSAETKITKS